MSSNHFTFLLDFEMLVGRSSKGIQFYKRTSYRHSTKSRKRSDRLFHAWSYPDVLIGDGVTSRDSRETNGRYQGYRGWKNARGMVEFERSFSKSAACLPLNVPLQSSRQVRAAKREVSNQLPFPGDVKHETIRGASQADSIFFGRMIIVTVHSGTSFCLPRVNGGNRQAYEVITSKVLELPSARFREE